MNHFQLTTQIPGFGCGGCLCLSFPSLLVEMREERLTKHGSLLAHEHAVFPGAVLFTGCDAVREAACKGRPVILNFQSSGLE